MLFQEPPFVLMRFALRHVSIPIRALREFVSSLDEYHAVLAVSVEVKQTAGSLAIASAEEWHSLSLERFSTETSSINYFDKDGKLTHLFALSPTSIFPDAESAASADMSFTVHDGAFVHAVEDDLRGSASVMSVANAEEMDEVMRRTQEPLSPAYFDTLALSQARRCIAFRLLLMRKEPPLLLPTAQSPNVTTQTESHASIARLAASQLRSRPLDENNLLHVVAEQRFDVFDVLQRQASAICQRSAETTRGLRCQATTRGTFDTPLQRVCSPDDMTEDLEHALGCKEHSSPISLDLRCLHKTVARQSSSVSLQGEHSQMPSILGPQPQLGRSDVDTTPRHSPHNIEFLHALLQRAEMTLFRSQWSPIFVDDLRMAGWNGDVLDGSPMAVRKYQQLSADVKEYLEKNLSFSQSVQRRATEYLQTQFYSATSYWTRDFRNFLVSLNFSPAVLRDRCSQRPHIPSAVRVGAQAFLSEVLEEITKPLAQAAEPAATSLAKALRTIAEEQVAEHEFCRSLLTDDALEREPVCPPLVAEVLRFLDCSSVGNGVSGSQRLQPMPLTPALRRTVNDFLRERTAVCPMESVEETVRRRCTELIASPFLSTVTEPWPEDVRSFLRAVDFMPLQKIKHPMEKQMPRDVRERARVYLEYRAEGKDPKVELARNLLSAPPFRLQSRPLSFEHVQTLLLIGFPLREFEKEASSGAPFLADPALRSDIIRFLNEFIRCHQSDPVGTLRRKELLRSPYLSSDTVYWPEEIRRCFAESGFFAEELSLPVYQLVTVPVYIRRAAQVFLEMRLRETFDGLLRMFPDASIIAFPAMTECSDADQNLIADDQAAQKQWTIVEEAAFNKDCIREDALSPPPPGSSGRIGDSHEQRQSLRQGANHALRSHVSFGGPDGEGEIHEDATSNLLHSSPNSSPPLNGVLSLSVSRTNSFPRSSSSPSSCSPKRSSAGGLANAQQTKAELQRECDLAQYLSQCSNSVASSLLRQQSIRPVVSVALVHDGSAEACALAASSTAAALVDYTWATLPAQCLSAATAAISTLAWTPIIFGSTSHTSHAALATALHIGLFETVTCNDATADVRSSNQWQAAPQAATAHVQSSDPLPSQAQHHLPSLGDSQVPFGAASDRVWRGTTNHVAMSRGGTTQPSADPYASALASSDRGSNAAFNGYPMTTSTTQQRTAARLPPPSLQARLASRTALSPRPNRAATINPFERVATPPRSLASSASLSTRNPFLPSPSTTNRSNPFSTASNPFLSSTTTLSNATSSSMHSRLDRVAPTAQQETDADILRMIKAAESAAGISPQPLPNTASQVPPRVGDWRERRAALEQQRREQLSQAFGGVSTRLQASSTPSLGGVKSSQRDDLPLGNVAGRRGPGGTVVNFDDIPVGAPATRSAAVQRSFDDVPVGGLSRQNAFGSGNSGGVGFASESRLRSDDSMFPKSSSYQLAAEQARAKEEIDRPVDLDPPPLTARRRMRETLSISPPKHRPSTRPAVSGPGGLRRVEPASGGLDIYSRPPASSRTENIFDVDPFSLSAGNVPASNKAGEVQGWRGTDDRPPASRVISFDDVPVGQPSTLRESGRPPLSGTTTTTTTASARPPLSIRSMTTAERIAAAAARRAAMQTSSSSSATQPPPSGTRSVPGFPNDDDVVVSVPRRPNPFQSLEDRPVGGSSRPTLSPPSPQGSLLPVPATSPPQLQNRSTLTAGLGAPSRDAARNPFGTAVDQNRFAPQRRAADPWAPSVREVRELQLREEQRQREEDEARRRVRNDQIVQQHLRGRAQQQQLVASVPPGEAGPCSATALSSSLRPTAALFLRGGAMRHSPLAPVEDKQRVECRCDLSFTLRAVSLAVSGAVVSEKILHDDISAVESVFSQTRGMTSMVVAPQRSVGYEPEPCALLVCSLRACSADDARWHRRFRLLVRVHSAEDFLRVIRRVPLRSAADVAASAARKRRSWREGDRFLRISGVLWSHYFRVAESWKSILQRPTARASPSLPSAVDAATDPAASVARRIALQLRVAAFLRHQETVATRLLKQQAKQQHFQNLTMGSGSEVAADAGHGFLKQTIFTAPLEVNNDDNKPMAVVYSRQRASGTDEVFVNSLRDVDTLHPTQIAYGLSLQRSWNGASLHLYQLHIIPSEPALLPCRRRRDALASVTSSTLRFLCVRLGLGALWILACSYRDASLDLLAVALLLFGLFLFARSMTTLGGGLSPAVLHSESTPLVLQAAADNVGGSGSNSSSTLCLQRSAANEAAGTIVMERLYRLLHGQSVVMSAILLGFAVAVNVLWFLLRHISAASNGGLDGSAHDALTDRDRYLGLPFHVSRDDALRGAGSVIVAQAQRLPLTASLDGFGVSELHLYVGFLMFAPTAVNPLKRFLQFLHRSVFRDVALSPSHTAV